MTAAAPSSAGAATRWLLALLWGGAGTLCAVAVVLALQSSLPLIAPALPFARPSSETALRAPAWLLGFIGLSSAVFLSAVAMGLGRRLRHGLLLGACALIGAVAIVFGAASLLPGDATRDVARLLYVPGDALLLLASLALIALLGLSTWPRLEADEAPGLRARLPSRIAASHLLALWLARFVPTAFLLCLVFYVYLPNVAAACALGFALGWMLEHSSRDPLTPRRVTRNQPARHVMQYLEMVAWAMLAASPLLVCLSEFGPIWRIATLHATTNLMIALAIVIAAIGFGYVRRNLRYLSRVQPFILLPSFIVILVALFNLELSTISTFPSRAIAASAIPGFDWLTTQTLSSFVIILSAIVIALLALFCQLVWDDLPFGGIWWLLLFGIAFIGLAISPNPLQAVALVAAGAFLRWRRLKWIALTGALAALALLDAPFSAGVFNMALFLWLLLWSASGLAYQETHARRSRRWFALIGFFMGWLLSALIIVLALLATGRLGSIADATADSIGWFIANPNPSPEFVRLDFLFLLAGLLGIWASIKIMAQHDRTPLGGAVMLITCWHLALWFAWQTTGRNGVYQICSLTLTLLVALLIVLRARPARPQVEAWTIQAPPVALAAPLAAPAAAWGALLRGLLFVGVLYVIWKWSAV